MYNVKLLKQHYLIIFDTLSKLASELSSTLAYLKFVTPNGEAPFRGYYVVRYA